MDYCKKLYLSTAVMLWSFLLCSFFAPYTRAVLYSTGSFLLIYRMLLSLVVFVPGLRIVCIVLGTVPNCVVGKAVLCSTS